MNGAGGVDARLRMEGVVKDYPVAKGGVLRVLDGISLHVERGEFVCLVGASGCGKSTLLAIAAGLEAPTSGRTLVDGNEVVGPGPECGLVFQAYSLYPWRTVAANVAFGLELQGRRGPEIRDRVGHYLAIMGLTDFAGSLPRELSGGMKQRAAIARALATGPEVLLLDEPFGALDAQTRSATREFVAGVVRETGATILMVTHDVEEAVFLSNRVYVLSPRPGRVASELDVSFGPNRERTLLRDHAFQDRCRDIDDLLHAQVASCA